MADFIDIRQHGYYYVDKTRYIPIVERAGRFLFLIRPRRFGKSLWLAVLACYYDLYRKDQFDAIFKGAYIHSHTTPEKSSYLLLRFNFSAVNPTLSKVESSFEDHCHIAFYAFGEKYKNLLDDSYYKGMERMGSSSSKLDFLFKYSQMKGLKVYVLIDEYDNFANTILSQSGKEKYMELTHGEGFFRHFFNVLKVGTTEEGSGVGRLFITGVSPLTMDDVTSGFNIGMNISMSGPFNEIMGFTGEEVREMISYYCDNGVITGEPEYHYEIMNRWYNNYRFSGKSQSRLFNTDMVLYYINNFLLSGDMPDNLIDHNAKTDYLKLRHLVVTDKEFNGNFSRLKEVIEEREVTCTINVSFPAEKLSYPDNFASLLFYLGLLTIDRTEHDETILTMPNEVIKRLYCEYLREGYEDTGKFMVDISKFRTLMRRMAYEGKWEDLFDFLSKEIREQTSIRDYLSGEKVIVGFLLAYLNITDHYVVQSEAETNKGYTDMLLEPFTATHPGMKYGYLLELKYIKRGEYSEETKVRKIEEARKQLNQYKDDARLQSINDKITLKKIILLFSGWEMVYMEEVAGFLHRK